jgi:hypothetical protein
LPFRARGPAANAPKGAQSVGSSSPDFARDIVARYFRPASATSIMGASLNAAIPISALRMQIIANLEQVVRQRAADLLSKLNPAPLEGAERRDPALMDSRRLSRRTHKWFCL